MKPLPPTDTPATLRRGDDVSNSDGKRRPRIDWDAAFAYFASDPTCTFTAVARKFKVSTTAVCKHAKPEKWNERRAALLAKGNAKVDGKIVQSHADRVQQMLRIRDAAAGRLETRLLSDAELDDQLVVRSIETADKITRLDAGEATDRIQVSEVNQLVLIVFRVAGEFVPREQRDVFVRRLDEATSGMLQLGSGEEAA